MSKSTHVTDVTHNITYSPRIDEQKRECPMSMSQFAQVTPPYTYIIRSKTIVIAAKC